MAEVDGLLVLLGAGASAAAGVPLAKELTERAARNLGSSDSVRTIHFVINAMKPHDVRVGNEQYQNDYPSIERLVSAVELLARRGELEVAPFIRDWDPMVHDLEANANPYHNYAIVRQVQQHFLAMRKPRPGDVHEDVRSFISLVEDITDDGELPVFRNLYYSLIRRLVEDVKISDQAATAYLRPLIEYVDSRNGTIATLNYDLTVETCARMFSITLNRLVDNWSTAGCLGVEGVGIPFIKLHGSVDWQVDPSGDNLYTSYDPLRNDHLPALVYGQREKLRIGGPFLELLDHFRRTLRSTNYLIVAGYSFGDDHINALLGRWMKRDSGHRLVVVDPYLQNLANQSSSAPTFLEMLWKDYGYGATTGFGSSAQRATAPRQLYVRRETLESFVSGAALSAPKPSDLDLTDEERSMRSH